MTLDEFVKMFADQFEDTDPSEITAETYFRELETYSSLIDMMVIVSISKIFGIKIQPEEFKKCEIVEDVYQLVQSKL